MSGCDLRGERLRVAFPRLGLLLDDVTEFRVCRRVLLHGEGLDDDLSPRRCEWAKLLGLGSLTGEFGNMGSFGLRFILLIVLALDIWTILSNVGR